MNKTMSCGINSGFKMFISVHQCMRNTFSINKNISLCRRFNTLKKVLKPVSLVKFSHHSIKDRTIRYEQNGLNTFLNNQQFVVPLACNLFSDDCNKPVTEDKKDEKNPKEKISLYKKFKAMYKDYWYVLVPVHLLTSCFWFGGFYYLAASGIDIPKLMESLGAPETWIENFKNSKAGNMVLAYTLYKIATPLRYMITLGGTTLSINYLKKWGWIKPVPNKEQIKKLYKEGKDVFKASYKDKMHVTKNEFLTTKHEMKKQLELAKEGFHKLFSETREDLKRDVKNGAEELKEVIRGINKELKKDFGKKKND